MTSVLLELRGLKRHLKSVEGEGRMKVQVYSVSRDGITWSPDGYLVLEDDVFSVSGVESTRSLKRLNLFLREYIDDPDKKEFLNSLSSVFHVPFCRFGDIIDETIDTNEKEENDEVEGISDTDDTEETE